MYMYVFVKHVLEVIFLSLRNKEFGWIWHFSIHDFWLIFQACQILLGRAVHQHAPVGVMVVTVAAMETHLHLEIASSFNFWKNVTLK